MFVEYYGKIHIHGFWCDLSDFLTYEPEYQASPQPIRYWSEARQYINDGANDFADPFFTQERFELFCSKIAEYQAMYMADHPDLPPDPEAPILRNDRLGRLNEDLHSYLTERGYDNGTQLSFQAIYIDLQELPELTEAQAQAKASIRHAWDFVRGVVLPFYYQKKAELELIDDYFSYSWDFHALDAADPCVSLRDIMLLLQEA